MGASVVVEENFIGPFVAEEDRVFSRQTWMLHVHEILGHFILRGLSADSQEVRSLKVICSHQDAFAYDFEPDLLSLLRCRADRRQPIVALFNRILVK